MPPRLHAPLPRVTMCACAAPSRWGLADIRAAAEACPDAVVLPKVESADTVRSSGVPSAGSGGLAAFAHVRCAATCNTHVRSQVLEAVAELERAGCPEHVQLW